MEKMDKHDRVLVEMTPVGFVSRLSRDENEKDRSLTTKIVFDEYLSPALEGIDEWSHIYVIFLLDRIAQAEKPALLHPEKEVGIFATRSPIHPNPIGLTLVELIKREGNEIWVRWLDAYDGTPVLDIKPYPDWWKGQLIVVTNYEIPGWLTDIMEGHE